MNTTRPGWQPGPTPAPSPLRAVCRWAVLAFACAAAPCHAQVSGYLPLDLDPSFEQEVEQLMAVAGQPVMTRPVPVSAVLDALPAACEADRPLCESVRARLKPWLRPAAVTGAGLQLAASSSDAPATRTLLQPDRHGEPMDSAWSAWGAAYARYGEHLLVNVGGVAHAGQGKPTGTFVSLGGSRLQVDAGYRDHWWSPATGSSWLLSSEAPTLPAVTISNPQSLGVAHLHYELFYGQLSTTSVSWHGGTFRGRPRLFGLHVSIEPAPGWSIGLGRLMEFGPAPRPASLRNLFNAFFKASQYDNTRPGLTTDQEFGNQQFSATASFTVPGAHPLVAYAEYAAEDTFHSESYRFGKTALTAGLYLPALTRRLGLRYEFSEWQNSWYGNHLYGDGMRNDGAVLGAWMGDWRVASDAVDGQAHSLDVSWAFEGARRLDLRLRTLQNASYSHHDYHRAWDLGLDHYRPWRGHQLGLGVEAGRDEFAARFARVSASLQFAPGSAAAARLRDAPPAEPGADRTPREAGRVERFVDVGLRSGKLRLEYDVGSVPPVDKTFGSAHLGLGVRRLYTRHSDFGFRVELDNVRGRALLGLRTVDYRYRLGPQAAVTAFFGVARYSGPTVAMGWYAGAGLQWRNVLPKWDLAIDLNYGDKLQRTKNAAGEHFGTWTDAYYAMRAHTITLSRRF